MKFNIKDRKKTFFHSVLRGMASPLTLFAAVPVYHVDAKQILEAHSFYQPKKSDIESLRSDWEKVGNDMRTAMEAHGNKAN